MSNQLGFTHERGFEGMSPVWLTPPEMIEDLGPFDLDPCAAVGQPWRTANGQFTEEHDGLSQDWNEFGLVWCNPPYGPETWKWLDRLSEHEAGGIALTFARTETAGFFRTVWQKADALLFIRGRLRFYRVNGKRGGTAGAPSVLIAYGQEAAARLRTTTIDGAFVSLKDPPGWEWK